MRITSAITLVLYTYDGPSSLMASSVVTSFTVEAGLKRLLPLMSRTVSPVTASMATIPALQEEGTDGMPDVSVAMTRTLVMMLKLPPVDLEH